MWSMTRFAIRFPKVFQEMVKNWIPLQGDFDGLDILEVLKINIHRGNRNKGTANQVSSRMVSSVHLVARSIRRKSSDSCFLGSLLFMDIVIHVFAGS